MSSTQQRFRGHILTLRRLRDVYRDVLDAGVRKELDAVIEELEQQSDHDQETDLGPLAQRAVLVIAAVVEIVTNLRDLLR